MDFGAIAAHWLGPCGALLAALALWRGSRLRRHAEGLEAEVEGLQDRVWRLAEEEERYRSLVEAQLDAVVQRDAAGRITFANAGYAGLLADAGEEALVGSSRQPEILESKAPRMRPDGARLVDEAIAAPEGTRWFAWVETTIPGAGGEPEILRAGRDVTERVAVEQSLEEARARAEAASGAKSRFLATVSHEFRTPLNGILGMAGLILDTPLTPEQATYTRAIKTSGEALLSLIDEILDFSKIEAGRIDLSAEPFDLPALVEGVVELLAPRAQGKGVEIAAYVAPDVPRLVIADGDRLRQVLVNLAGNAVKFTEIGGVGIAVERDGEGRIVLAVQDTGPGIALERLPLLFEEFEQGDASPSRRHGGTGLGLAITRRIVESMGGAIEVESRQGEGSTFRVRLALAAGEAEARGAGPSLAGRRVLLLARSPFEAPYLARRMAEAGAEVALVESAVDALAKLATSAWDMLIADCALGEGVRDVAQEARRAGIRRSLVLLSPFDRRDFGSPSAAGFDGYLVKPVRPRSLLQQVTEVSIPDRVETPAAPAPTARRPKREATARVLLAEDNEINALLALKALEKLGAIVDWAKDGHEALSLAEATFSGIRPGYDLVLMDVRMPGLDGLEATRRIRRIEEALGRAAPLHIVALTANALREDQEDAHRAGVDGFLAKPLDFKALADLLAERSRDLAKAS